MAAQAIDVERAVPAEVWQLLLPWLHAQATQDPYWRSVRATVLLLHDSGMRVFEAAAADRVGLRQVGGDGPL